MNKKKTISSVLLVIFLLIELFPFYIMVVGSLKPSTSFYYYPMDFSLFHNVSFNNFFEVCKKVDFVGAYVNSILITFFTTIITLFVAQTAGFVFAKKSFPGKPFLFTLVIVTMILPRQLLMIPNFLVAKHLGLINTILGTILTSVNTSYGIFLFRQYIMSVPNELEEAAVIDGCSQTSFFFRILTPLLKPVTISLVIFTMFSTWNDFIWQNIMLSTKKLRTIPLALSYLTTIAKDKPTIGLELAGSLLTTIPLIIVFLIFQKYFIEGIDAGAIKG